MISGKCPYCGNGEIIWGGDHTFEDCGMEGEGIVQNFSCSSPEEVCGVSILVDVPQNPQE